MCNPETPFDFSNFMVHLLAERKFLPRRLRTWSTANLKHLNSESRIKIQVYRKRKIIFDCLDMPFAFFKFLKWHFISKFIPQITSNKHLYTSLLKKLCSCIFPSFWTSKIKMFPVTWTCNPKELALVSSYRKCQEIIGIGKFSPD